MRQKGFVPILILITIIILVGLGAFLYGKLQGIRIQSPQPTPSVTIPETSPTPQARATANPQGDKITSIDNTWNLYTNYDNGFSIKVPKVAAEYGGKCVDGKMDVETVPVKIFKDTLGAYITFEYFYEYPTDNNCQKITNSFSIIDQRANLWKTNPQNHLFVPSNWHIVTAKVENDSELENFIKVNWGSGCKLGEKTLNSSGVYDVKVQGDGLDLSETKCPINFVLALKYSSELKKVATWGVGQSVVFSANNFQTTYDQEIIGSFKFTQ
jgi:hypothetical protein